MRRHVLAIALTAISIAGCGGSAVTSPVTPATGIAATPAFSPISGTFTAPQSVTISDSTAGAAIYYTTNGTTPTTLSSVYSSAIPVSSTTTIEAMAVVSGYTNSAVASGTFTISSSPVPAPTRTVTDVDGNVYGVILIGTQYWTQQNLKTTHFNDNSAIPLIADATTWGGLTTPAYGYYNFDEADHGPTYGALYNWYAVNTGKLCPAGWHVPTSDEWQTLFTYEGGINVAGGPLKATGATLWETPNTAATNASGFTGLPGGGIDGDGSSGHITQFGKFWSSSAGDAAELAIPYYFPYDNQGVGTDNYPYQGGLSIRCLQN